MILFLDSRIVETGYIGMNDFTIQVHSGEICKYIPRILTIIAVIYSKITKSHITPVAPDGAVPRG